MFVLKRLFGAAFFLCLNTAMKILVGFSAGVESTALMHWCLNNGHETIAYHYSNGMRTTTLERMMVAAWCREHNVPLITSVETFDYGSVDLNDKTILLFSWWPKLVQLATRIDGLDHWACGLNCDEDTVGQYGETIAIPYGVAMHSVLKTGASFISPLQHMTKQEQYDTIPAEWRNRLFSCYNGGNCGKCQKCLEYRKLK